MNEKPLLEDLGVFVDYLLYAVLLYYHYREDYQLLDKNLPHPDIPTPILRAVKKELLLLGYIHHVKGCMNDDGEVTGSYTYITREGNKFLEKRLKVYPRIKIIREDEENVNKS